MQLTMNPHLAEGYKNRSQITRIVSEDWGACNLYCPACEEYSLIKTPANTKVIDYICPRCKSNFQLKSGQRWNEERIPDAGYNAMVKAILKDSFPNLFVLQYKPDWTVYNLMLIPFFFFTPSVLEKRKPLASSARRAGWIGCNILLKAIPSDGKIRVIYNGEIENPKTVRKEYTLMKPLLNISADLRGWTLDVYRMIRSLGHPQFSLHEAYALEKQLSELYPNNRHIKEKIRQQLQVLRDYGILEFLGDGKYAFKTD